MGLSVFDFCGSFITTWIIDPSNEELPRHTPEQIIMMCLNKSSNSFSTLLNSGHKIHTQHHWKGFSIQLRTDKIKIKKQKQLGSKVLKPLVTYTCTFLMFNELTINAFVTVHRTDLFGPYLASLTQKQEKLSCQTLFQTNQCVRTWVSVPHTVPLNRTSNNRDLACFQVKLPFFKHFNFRQLSLRVSDT